MTPRLMLALAPAALALATIAYAQPAAAPRHGPPGAEMNAHHETMRKQHLEDLKTVLRLRPDQEPALSVFVDAHKPKIHEMKRPHETGARTTPQRLDEMAKHEAEMAAGHQRMRDALAKFYAALSPEQQKVFDALHRLKGSHGGPMMMHGDGPGRRGGPRVIMKRHGGAEGPMHAHDAPR